MAVINGNNHANILFGTNSNDSINGLGGDDSLFGRGGNDTLYGGDGNDALDGGSGRDILYGGDSSDLLSGGDGDDQSFGGGGDDLFTGDEGADLLNGGSGFDTVSYLTSGNGVTVDLAGLGHGGDAEGDSYVSIEAVVGSNHDDEIAGNTSSNRLTGGLGDDTLTGRGGDDKLYGGLGSDHMNGGAGNDTFIYAALLESQGSDADTISGFTIGEDRIDLSAIDTDLGQKGDQEFTFIGTGDFTGAGAEVRYETGNGHTTVFADYDGDKQADFKLVLNGEMALTAGELIL